MHLILHKLYCLDITDEPTRSLKILTGQVTLVEQAYPTLPEHESSLTDFSDVREDHLLQLYVYAFLIQCSDVRVRTMFMSFLLAICFERGSCSILFY